MANEGYTIRDFGDEMWLVWVGYEQRGEQGRNCRVTRFVAQINSNPEVREWVKGKFADDLNARFVDMGELTDRFYSAEGE